MPYPAYRAKNVHAAVIDLTIPLPFLSSWKHMKTWEIVKPWICKKYHIAQTEMSAVTRLNDCSSKRTLIEH